jgi:excisionase family DNA binding protein
MITIVALALFVNSSIGNSDPSIFRKEWVFGFWQQTVPLLRGACRTTFVRRSKVTFSTNGGKMDISKQKNASSNQGIDQLLTVSDVAEVLNVSESLLYQMLDAGKLPHLRIGNGRGVIRFDPADIVAYLKTRRVIATPTRESALRFIAKHMQPKPQ